MLHAGLETVQTPKQHLMPIICCTETNVLLIFAICIQYLCMCWLLAS